MKKILAIIDHVYEDLELWYPKIRLEEAGHQVTVAAPAAGETYSGKHGYPCVSDAAISDLTAADFDALLVPGGFAPDKLRRDPDVLSLVKAFNETQKPIGHICHAGWILISADVLRGRRTTSTVGIKDDMNNAGATWVDEAVVIDGNTGGPVSGGIQTSTDTEAKGGFTGRLFDPEEKGSGRENGQNILTEICAIS